MCDPNPLPGPWGTKEACVSPNPCSQLLPPGLVLVREAVKAPARPGPL